MLEPGTGQLAFRETHFDKQHEKLSDLRMELVPAPGELVPPPMLSTEELAPKLEFAAMFLTFVGATAQQMWHDAAANMNNFGGQAGAAHVAAQEDEVRTHTNAEMTYHGGRFELEPDEALVVTVHEPDTPFLYWGLTLTSSWMESFDYRYTTTNLNNKRATRSADGSWRLVIAPDDPGPGSTTGSTPAVGFRATCSCAGSWRTRRRIRRRRSSRRRTWRQADPAGPGLEFSDFGWHPETLLVRREQRAVGRQVEPGVGEGVVVPRTPGRCAAASR